MARPSPAAGRRFDPGGPALDAQWPCRLYRILGTDPHNRGEGAACLWLGESSRVTAGHGFPIERVVEHVTGRDKQWRYRINGVEVDQTVFASKRAAQRAEEIATKTGRWGLPWNPHTGEAVEPRPDWVRHGVVLRVDPRPIYPVENNRGNPWRIDPRDVARHERQAARGARVPVPQPPPTQAAPRRRRLRLWPHLDEDDSEPQRAPRETVRVWRRRVTRSRLVLLWLAVFVTVWALLVRGDTVDAGEAAWPGLIAACLLTGVAVKRRRRRR